MRKIKTYKYKYQGSQTTDIVLYLICLYYEKFTFNTAGDQRVFASFRFK